MASCIAHVQALEQCLTPQLVTQLLCSASTPSTSFPTPSTFPTPAIGGQGPIHSASLLLVEANLSEAAIVAACEAAAQAGVPVFLEPVSVPKSVRCVALRVAIEDSRCPQLC